MSYIYNNEMKFSDNSQLDAFGRLRTSELTSVIEIKHIYSKNTLLIDEIIGGTGATSTYTPGNADIEMSVAYDGDYVIRATKSRGIYQPGKSALFECTMMNFDQETDVVKRVGYYSTTSTAPFDSDFDGIFLQNSGIVGGTGSGVYENEGISFQVWRNGTKIFDVPASAWDNSQIDPTTDIDWQKNQLFWFDFQWLGVGRVRWGLYLEDYTQIQLGEVVAANNTEDPYMRSPNQPVRYEIRSVGGTGEFHQLCATFGVEGSINSLKKIAGLYNSVERTAPVIGTKYAYTGFRLKGDYPGANLNLESVSSLSSLSSHDFLVTLEMNPVLADASTWSDIENSPIQYAFSGGASGATLGAISTSGYVIASWIQKGGGSSSASDINLFENVIRPGVCVNGTLDEVWICVTPVTSANSRIKVMTTNISYFD
jgi:hypothetical protein